MVAYYNEIDTFAARWLRNLIAAGHIAPGDVDERSIEEVQPDDLTGYDRCHFFAGIAGWDLALQLAKWPDDRPVWTGSCPCQPLSSAGQRKGHADERHLWPAFYRLIAECQPGVVFGEQVASKDGREWFSAVRTDLERVGYACGAADLPAAGVGAPHIRQRLWWVANADGGDASSEGLQCRGEHGLGAEDGGTGWVEHTECAERGPKHRPRRVEGLNGVPQRQEGSGRIGGAGEVGGMGDAAGAGPQGQRRFEGEAGEGCVGQPRPPSRNGFWDAAEGIPCGDGKSRPVEPGIFPLAHGVPARVGRLRAYGNAIVPSLAAEFIAAFMECRP